MRSYRGLTERTDNADKQPFGYTGRPTDPITGLRDHRARWLNPRNGRWQSEDPIGFAGGDSNLYRYVGNSWPNATDPSGKVISWGTALVGAALGGVLGAGVEVGMQLLVHGEVRDWNAVIGAGVGGAVGGFVAGAAAGALTGDVSGLALAGALVAAGPGAGLLGAVAGNVTTQALNLSQGQQTGGFDFGQVAIAAAGGAFGGAVGGAVGGVVARGVGGALGRALGGLVGGASGGAAGGAVGGGLSAWREGRDWREGALEGAAQGLVGGVGGAAGGLALGGGAGLGLRATGLGKRLSAYVHTEEGPLGQRSWRNQAAAALADFAWLKACFAAEVPLLVPGGSRRIADVRVGDVVLARDEGEPEGAVEAKVVEEVFVRTGRIWHLHVGGRVVRTTGEHPFWAQGRGWVPARELRAGELLLGHDGRQAAVEEVYDSGEYETVYNLRVADFHTYFVGCDEWGFSVWAHNRNCTWHDNPDEMERLARRYIDNTAPLPGETARRRANYAEIIGPEHAQRARAQQRVDEKAIRDYVRDHPDLGGTVPTTNGGNRGSNPDTARTLGSIDAYYRARGLDPLPEQDFHHLPGRLSEATHRTADRVVIDQANKVVRVIQSAEVQPSGNLAPREIAPAGDILASRQVANWRSQGYDVRVEMILRGQDYHPNAVITERGVRSMLTPDLYPRGERPALWQDR